MGDDEGDEGGKERTAACTRPTPDTPTATAATTTMTATADDVLSRGDVALRWEPRERRIDRRASGTLDVESDVDQPPPSTCGLPLQSQLRD
jgi:hypothetical protein